MAIAEHIIDQIRSTADIVEIVGEHVSLKKAGTNYKGLCPFHREKTPSFVVSPQKQIYHCFGCGQGGNVFSFLMSHDHLTFAEAVKHLGKKYNIVVPETAVTREKKSRMRRFVDLYRATNTFFQQQLRTAAGEPARKYLSQRAFSTETVERFGIGYSGSTRDGLYRFLRAHDFTHEDICSSGMAVETSSRLFDFFRQRLMFPIWNSKGEIVAFGGRTLGNDEPKYINSSETEFFRKRYELYGYHAAKRAIAQAGRVIIVEGYSDVIRLVQAGIPYVVATLGTAITPEHIKLLKRLTKQAVVIYDRDRAGVMAAVRSLDVFLTEGMHSDIVLLPEGQDPDSFVREKGKDALLEVLQTARPLFDFKITHLLEQHDYHDHAGLVAITGEIIETLKLVSNSVLLDRFIKLSAERLGIHEQSLRQELSNQKNKKKHDDGHEPRQRLRQTFQEELVLLKVIIESPQFLEHVLTVIGPDDFERDDAREIFHTITDLYQNNDLNLEWARLTNRVRSPEAKQLLSQLPFIEYDEQTSSELVSERLRDMQVRRYQRQTDELYVCIKEAEKKGDHDTVLKLQQAVLDIKRNVQQLRVNDSVV